MKQIYIIAFLLSMNLFSQIKKVEYIIYTKGLSEKIMREKMKPFRDKRPDMADLFEEQIKINLTIPKLKFDLFYNKEKSIFVEQVQEIEEVEKSYFMRAKLVAFIDVLAYKSKAEKFNHKKPYGGKLLKVKYPNKYYNWKLTKQKKKILGYPCELATADYETTNKGVKTKRQIYAWFTRDIAHSYGPAGIDGLPGLILEVTKQGRVFFLAKNIMDADAFPKLGKPTGTITVFDYDKKIKDNISLIKRKAGRK